MRLLNVHTLTLRDYSKDIHNDQVPAYAILSHRWFRGGEITLQDVESRSNTHFSGFLKLQAACDFVKQYLPQIHWIWLDTACIDRKSSAILSEAINSMFRYYQEAEICLAYMEDVQGQDSMSDFRASSWFRRGWTLQEMLAPSFVLFLCRDWKVIGHKKSDHDERKLSFDIGKSLTAEISAITGIAECILTDYEQSRSLSAEDKLKWLRGRQTTRGEDMSYCMLGLLGTGMPAIYGEGEAVARQRLMATLHVNKLAQDTLSPNKGSANGELSVRRHLLPQRTTASYIERPSLSQDLERLLAIPYPGGGLAHAAVVTGIGGSGKTQLILRYLETHQQEYSCIIWIDCRTEATLLASFERHCVALQLSNASGQDKSQSKVDAVLQWIESLQQAWLVVMDNADDHSWDLAAKLPRGSSGTIIVTSQDSLSRNLFERGVSHLRVDTMEQAEAVALLVRGAGSTVQHSGHDADCLESMMCSAHDGCRLTVIAQDIASSLAYHPLALDLAASKITFDIAEGEAIEHAYSQYLNDVRHHRNATLGDISSNRMKSTLQDVFSTSLSTIRTIESHASHLHATNLLSLFAHLDRNNIQDELFCQASQKVADLSQRLQFEVPSWIDTLLARKADGSWDDFYYRAATSLLLRFGLVKRIKDQWHGFNMHGLVQWRAEQDAGAAEGLAMFVVAAAASNMTGAAVLITNDQLRFTQSLVLHWCRKKTRGFSTRQAAQMLTIMGEIIFTAGNQEEAYIFLTKAVTENAELFGEQAPETLEAMINLATVCLNSSRPSEAGSLNQAVLRQRRELLGDENELTLEALGLQSEIDLGAGRYAEAASTALQVCTSRERLLGKEHISTLRARHTLAIVYEYQGKVLRAEHIYHEVLLIERATLGDLHYVTLWATADLARLYVQLSYYDRAEEMLLEVLQAYQQLLGPSHTTTLNTMVALAVIYGNQGRWHLACGQLELVVETARKVYGERYASTMPAMIELANCYAEQGRWSKASEIFQPVLTTRTSLLGERHSFTLSCKTSFARMLFQHGKVQESLAHHKEILNIAITHLGDDDPTTIVAKLDIASIYVSEEEWSKAEELQLQARVSATILAEADTQPRDHTQFDIKARDSPLLLWTTNDLAKTYHEQGRLNEAETLRERHFELMVEQHGYSHQQTLDAADCLADTYRKLGRLTDAEALQDKTTRERFHRLGDTHRDTLESLSRLAWIYSDQERDQDAEDMLRKVLSAKEQTYGEAHVFSLVAMNDLADFYLVKKRYNEAITLATKTLQSRIAMHGPQHAWTISEQEKVAEILKKQKKFNDEMGFRRQILSSCQAVYGTHVLTIHAMSCLVNVLSWLDEWSEAEAIQNDIIAMSEDLLGSHHDKTLDAIANKALAWHKRGRSNAAARLLEALIMTAILHGEPHPSVFSYQSYLASVYSAQGRKSEAVSLQEQVIASMVLVHGEDHFLTVEEKSKLAQKYAKLDRAAEAESIYSTVLQVISKRHGPKHAKTYAAMFNLADAYRQRYKWEEAVAMLSDLVDGRTALFGDTHELTLKAMSLLGVCLRDIEPLRACKVHTTVMEATELDTIERRNAMEELAQSYRSNKQYKWAMHLRKDVLDITRKKDGTDSNNALRAELNLACSYDDLGHFDKAESTYRRLIYGSDGSIITHGAKHNETLSAMHSFATELKEQRQYWKAERVFRKVIEHRSNILGPEHCDTLWTISVFASMLDTQDRFAEAEELMLTVISGRAKLFGRDDEQTLVIMMNLSLMYYRVQRYHDAEKLQVQVVSISRTRFELDHVDTFNRVIGLGTTWAVLGQHTALEPLAHEIFEVISRNPGGGRNTQTAMLLVAYSIQETGRFQFAKQHGADAYKIVLENADEEHFGEWEWVMLLGLIYRAREDYHKARHLYDNAIVVLSSKQDGLEQHKADVHTSQLVRAADSIKTEPEFYLEAFQQALVELSQEEKMWALD